VVQTINPKTTVGAAYAGSVSPYTPGVADAALPAPWVNRLNGPASVVFSQHRLTADRAAPISWL
jgi:hypothetical protein